MCVWMFYYRLKCYGIADEWRLSLPVQNSINSSTWCYLSDLFDEIRSSTSCRNYVLLNSLESGNLYEHEYMCIFPHIQFWEFECYNYKKYILIKLNSVLIWLYSHVKLAFETYWDSCTTCSVLLRKLKTLGRLVFLTNEREITFMYSQLLILCEAKRYFLNGQLKRS